MTHAIEQIETQLIGVVEAKVKSASTAATISTAVLAVLGELLFHGGTPGWVAAIVATAITGGLTFIAGWLTKHTPQPSAPVTAVIAPVVAPAEQTSVLPVVGTLPSSGTGMAG